jgi:hypothetical protein
MQQAKDVHRISGDYWTGITAHELPLCGRTDNEAMVNRTNQDAIVTCAACLKLLKGRAK